MDRVEFRHNNLSDIPGFKTTPNSEAKWIVDDLGLSFPKGIPAKGRLNSIWHRLAIRLAEPALARRIEHTVGPFMGIKYDLMKLRGFHYKFGIGLPEINSILTWANWLMEDETTLHENGHILIAQIKPEIKAYMEDFLQKYQNKSGITHPNTPPQIRDQYKAFYAWDEGIAEWITWEIQARRMGLASRQQIFTFHEDNLSFKQEGAITTDAIADVGHWGILTAMDALVCEGLPINKALVLLIQNPPTKIDDIRNIESFVKGLPR